MFKDKKILAVVPARAGSKGLPGKNIRSVAGKPLIAWTLEAAKQSPYIDKVIVSTDGFDIAEVAKTFGVDVPFMRPEHLASDTASSLDVLFHAIDFFAQRGETFDYIIMLEPTSPLRTVEDINLAIEKLASHPTAKAIVGVAATESAHPDFTVVTTETGLIKPFTDGSGLGAPGVAVKRRQDLAHVYFPEGTIYISDIPTLRERNTFYHDLTLAHPVDRYKQFEVDEEMDLVVISALLKNREKQTIQKRTASKGVDLWRRAKQIIPGGSQLLSKRSELFLPDQWPSYFTKAKGVTVTDMDGNNFIDMTIMGIGACALGYADEDVNEAVKKCIDNGSMSTLNSFEEVALTEELLRLHPWAGMARYARTGGEAMAIAVRIARAKTGKDKVAFCGYHGWHDWYLAANLSDDKNLDGHLLPGLEPKGVPRALKGTSIPFKYNDIDALKHILETNPDVGVIVLETKRHTEPENNFLQNVVALAKQHGAVLIFDEITTGWRAGLGGIFQDYNVIPDIVVYGKSIANGFAMSAIVGTKEVMDAAQTSFISSTFWTERTGFVAALATIKKMIEHNVPAHLVKIGNQISAGWKQLAEKHGLTIEVCGIPPLTTFKIQHEQSQVLHTLFTQEMLKRGYLASKSIYVCYAHTEDVVAKYLETVDEVFGVISRSLANNTSSVLLNGPVAHAGFKRLT